MGILIRNTTDYAAGEVFYYRSKCRTFGGVFLFHQLEYYLIALSEEITKTPKTICTDDVLQSPLYTLAWFSDADMLSPIRLHRISVIPLDVDYSNRAGLMVNDKGVTIRNVGQSATWKHEFRSFALRDTPVKSILNNRFVPKTWL